MADFDGQGLGFQATAAAAGTDPGAGVVFILRFADGTETAALGTGTLLAVKLKQAGIKAFKADTAGRADAV